MASLSENMEGPVIKAAKLALEMENVNYALPFVKKDFEEELKNAFEKTMMVRDLSGEAAELADYWFFETTVRLHKLGKGAYFTGLKPPEIDGGPVISMANKAIETEDLGELREFLMEFMGGEIEKRFQAVVSRKNYRINDVEAARSYAEAMMEFLRFSHNVYRYVELCGE